MPAGPLVLTGVQEAGVHAARAIVTCRSGQRAQDPDHRARRERRRPRPRSPPPGCPGPRVFISPQIMPLPRPYLASTCRKRSARGRGSPRGAGTAQTHRRCPRHSPVPRSLAARGGAGLGTPKAWSRATPPVDTAGLTTPDMQLPTRPDPMSLIQPRGPQCAAPDTGL